MRYKSFAKIAALNIPALFISLGGVVQGRPAVALIPVLLSFMGLAYYWIFSLVVLKTWPVESAPESVCSLVNKLEGIFGVKVDVKLFGDQKPTAFIAYTGPGRYVILITKGLLDTLTEGELEAVLGHELAHVKNRDFVLKSFLLAYRFVYLPIGQLLYAALSREREYLADETSAALTGRPLELATALLKTSPVYGATAKLVSSAFLKVFSEHPPIKSRVERLLKLYIQQ